MKGYHQWYLVSFGRECSVLYRENILDYISYLRNIKKDTGRTINCKISALIKYNEFLIEKGIQQDQVVSKKDVFCKYFFPVFADTFCSSHPGEFTCNFSLKNF
jgi:site-specific recombinase XerD